MASTQQRPPARQPSSGKDVLSRMLQLEKLSKQRRSVGVIRSTSPPQRALARHSSTGVVPLIAQQSKPSKPTPLSRSHTTPELAIQSVADKQVSEDDSDPTSPSICRSPSWSNYGKYKRKKEKEQKEGDIQKNVTVKPGKRLSKKPPAAMETQRMSAALRTPSGISPISPSTSQEHSKRSSSEERRSSITSIGSSFMEYMRPSSRKGTRSRETSPTGKEKKMHDGDISEFGYQFNKSVDKKRDPSLTPTKEPRIASAKRSQLPDTPPSSRNSQEPVLSPTTQTRFALGDAGNHKQGTAERQGYESPNLNKTHLDGTSKATFGKASSTQAHIMPASSGNPSTTERRVHNDHSYVQKQRMHQQQRSIAGYKDELAVGDWYTPLQWPPTPKDSTESIAKSQKTNTAEMERPAALKAGSKNTATTETERPTVSNANSKNTITAEREKPSDTAIEEDDPLDDTFSWYNASLAEEARLVRKKGTNKHGPSKPDTATGFLKDQKPTDNLANPSTNPISSVSYTASPAPGPSKQNEDIILKESKNVKRKSTNASKPKYVIQPERVASEATIEGIPDDGLYRQKSLYRHHSDPELMVSADVPKSPALDFLPELKHQPLVKPKRESLTRTSVITASTEIAAIPSTSQFPVRVSKMDFSPPSSASALQTMVKPKPIPPFPSKLPEMEKERSSKRSSSTIPSPLRLSPASSPNPGALSPKPLAKMFVICCKCKYWHDMPSRLYEAMALPRKIVDGDKIAKSIGARHWSDGGKEKEKGKGKEGLEGKVYTEVKCPWCAHGMSTTCCAGWTAVVYLHERHH